jgi:glyoxylase-like metal-dependent hydrolase (beta-lactamase superfamily II)
LHQVHIGRSLDHVEFKQERFKWCDASGRIHDLPKVLPVRNTRYTTEMSRTSHTASMIKVLLCCCTGMPICGGAFATSTRIAPDTDVIFGVYIPDQQPDGNSIVIRGPEGLIVIDTGRHLQHTQQLIDFAQQAHRPIRAIINSHWHLDHIGGDARIRKFYPDVQIYASDALNGAMNGFLAKYSKYLEDEIGKSPEDLKAQGWRDELALIGNLPSALPTEVVTKTAPFMIAGRELVLHLETYSVTAGDVWVFDPATRVLAAGDLVTLPVPFLDTACPQHWKTALGNLAAADFKILIPGHGPPMHRRKFARYRHAYENLFECAAGAKSKEQCADGWVHDVGNLLGDNERSNAKSLLVSYMDTSLRGDPKRIARLCGA